MRLNYLKEDEIILKKERFGVFRQIKQITTDGNGTYYQPTLNSTLKSIILKKLIIEKFLSTFIYHELAYAV